MYFYCVTRPQIIKLLSMESIDHLTDILKIKIQSILKNVGYVKYLIEIVYTHIYITLLSA